MKYKKSERVWVDSEIIEAIKLFPVEKEIEHCGNKFVVQPFEFHAECPTCRIKIRLRSSSAFYEIEDVFDAVFIWMACPEKFELAKQRRQKLIESEKE